MVDTADQIAYRADIQGGSGVAIGAGGMHSQLHYHAGNACPLNIYVQYMPCTGYASILEYRQSALTVILLFNHRHVDTVRTDAQTSALDPFGLIDWSGNR